MGKETAIEWCDTNTKPPEGEMVLLETGIEEHPVWLGYWDGDRWIWCCGGSHRADEISGWQPLPKARR